MSNSARLGCCEKYCHGLKSFSLQIFSVADAAIAVVLFYGAIYIKNQSDQNIYDTWLPAFALVLGGVLIIISSLSCCATSAKFLRWLIIPSAYIALLIG